MNFEMPIKYITLHNIRKTLVISIDPVLGRLWSPFFIQASASFLKSCFISHYHLLKSESITSISKFENISPMTD